MYIIYYINILFIWNLNQTSTMITMAEQSVATLRPLILYCLQHDMLDTAEFTAERLLSQTNSNIFNMNEQSDNHNNHNNNTYNSSSTNNTNHNANNNNNNNNINDDDLNLNININMKLNNDLNRHEMSGIIGTPTPRSFKSSKFLESEFVNNNPRSRSNSTTNKRKFSFSNLDASDLQLDSIHLYAHVLYKQGKFKSAFNITSQYCGVHVGCAYIFAQCCKELNKEPDGIRALLMTLNLWENLPSSFNDENFSILPDSISCYLLLARLYSLLNDIPRATVHYTKVLKLNPFIFEAFEDLCDLGVKVNVDSIYKIKYSIIENNDTTSNNTNINTNNNNDNDEPNIKNTIFKTPITKLKQPTIIPTSSPDISSTYMTPISNSMKPGRASIRNSTNLPVNPKSLKNTSITSRLLHNNTSFGNNHNNNSNISTNNNKDLIDNNNIFKSNNHSTKFLKSNTVFNNSSSLFDLKNNNKLSTSSSSSSNDLNYNEYQIKLYSKLAKGYLATTVYDCFKAIRIFDSLTENERNTPWVLSKLGKLHFEIVNYEEAELYFKKLRKIDKTRIKDMEYYSTLLWHLQKEVELSYLAHELFEINPNSDITWICIGNLFSFKKETEDAIKCFQKAIDFNPNCFYAYTLKGHEYLSTDSFENSMNSFRHSIVLNKRHYNAFYGIGMVYLKLGDFGKAEFHFRKAVEINPVNVILLCCVGMVLEKLGKYEESLKQYEFGSKLQPLSMLPLFKKAHVLFHMKQYNEALKDFQKLENLVPDEASIHFLLGKLYKHFGRKNDAVKQFTISLNLDPKGSHLIRTEIENLNGDILSQ